MKLNPDSKALNYFIEDPLMVLSLLYIYQESYLNLIKSRSSFPSLLQSTHSLKMEISTVIKSVMKKDPAVFRRNAKRKELYQLFKDVLRNNAGRGIRDVNKSALRDLLKELSG